MTKSRFSSYAASFTALALLIVLPGCSRNSTSEQANDLLSQAITPENVSQISEGAKTELSYDEYRLVLDYLKRVHPELTNGQLPTGLTLHTIIESQRDFEASSSGQAADSKSTTAQESPAVIAATAEKPPSTPPATKPTPASAQSSRTPASSAEAAPEPAATARTDVPAPPPQSATEVLPKGTPFKVRLDQVISSKQNQDGDTFKATLEDDLIVDGKLVAPQGSKVVGRLSNVKASGKVQGRATLSVALTSIEVGQEAYGIRTNTLAFEAQGTGKADATKVGIGAGLGAVIGAIAGGGKGAAIGGAIGAGAGTGVVLATPGKDVEFGVEQLFSFQLDQDVEMQVVRT
ncbi:MAG: hypothetical protein P8020_19830 [Acidobacteriota bacterium]|jgi:hypothetical protein